MLNALQIAAEFPLHPDLVYLNHAAVTPWPRRTTAAMIRFAEENSRYGASRYPDWVAVETQVRQQLQTLINAQSADEIALVKNTSEAISIVACGLDWREGDNVVSTDHEFPSNRIAWQAQQRHGVSFREVNIDGDDPEGALIAACDGHTRVLTVSSVQYATGRRLDLQRLGRYCRDHSILFCVDAIQSLGAMQIDVEAIQADFLMADAHKWLLGPEGIALFYCRAEQRDKLQLYQYGWHMVEAMGDYDSKAWEPAHSSRRFECGSLNMAGIHALGASLSLLADIGTDSIEKMVLKNSAYLIDKLNNIADVNVVTPQESDQHAGIVSFTVNGRDNSKIQRKLMENSVICAYRGGAIRFSPHFYTGLQKLDKAIEILNISICFIC
jgi:cysteine desulfurase/selenocysteine lyase